ncbi:MAG: HIT domain-containing protein [Parachlamydiaceae bacterium]
MTIFARIIKGELPADKVYEDDKILAIRDIYPQAPVHILIMPKKAYKDIHSVPEEDISIIGDIVKVAQKIAEEEGIEEGYRLVTNNGASAGQTIFHLHFHLLGGRSLSGGLG